MNTKIISRSMIALLLVVLVSSFSYEAPAKKFSPAGTWEYSIPGVTPGYENGSMTIAEIDGDYTVTMALNEYNTSKAVDVEYNKKEIKFTIWVEGEEVIFKGIFDSDKFTGSVSYFEGTFDMTAVRKVEK